MLGSRLKSWMELHIGRSRSSVKLSSDSERSISGSASNDTNILLNSSSGGSFATQNLSSPDTGYSTDGYSPKSNYPTGSFLNSPSIDSNFSKTKLLTKTSCQNESNEIFRPRTESPRKPPRARFKNADNLDSRNCPVLENISKMNEKITIEPSDSRADKIFTNEMTQRSSFSSVDSGVSFRNSRDSFTPSVLNRYSQDSGIMPHLVYPLTICEEGKETDILSDWAPTDEDVDERVLTPTSLFNISESSEVGFDKEEAIKIWKLNKEIEKFQEKVIIPAVLKIQEPPNKVPLDREQFLEMPKAYETLQLLNQCNHLFPLPTCTGPRCLRAQVSGAERTKRKSKLGALKFLKRIFSKKKQNDGKNDETDFPENSRGKSIRAGPGGHGYWLTPTPNSFRRKNSENSVVSSTKGVKSDIIRLPQSTPLTWTPSLSRQDENKLGVASPFLNQMRATPTFLNNSTTTLVSASPASVRIKPQQIVTPIIGYQNKYCPDSGIKPGLPLKIKESSSKSPICPKVQFEGERCLNSSNGPISHKSSPVPSRFNGSNYSSIAPSVSFVENSSPKPLHSRIQPSYNNYSPIHRLVVTTGVHRANINPESPLVRNHNLKLPPPPPPRLQSALTPNLNDSHSQPCSKIRNHNPRFNFIASSNQNSPNLSNAHRNSLNSSNNSSKFSPLVNKSPAREDLSKNRPLNWDGGIYEKVGAAEVSDEGDGEGGDYEWDISFGDSELSQESSKQSSSIYSQNVNSYSHSSNKIPMSWGTRLSETEMRLLEREADLKYKRLIWEAEVLLRHFTVSNSKRMGNGAEEGSKIRGSEKRRELLEYCPQSDPLRRKTYDCWALRRLQQEMASSCASPPVLHRSRFNLIHSSPRNSNISQNPPSILLNPPHSFNNETLHHHHSPYTTLPPPKINYQSTSFN